MINSKWDSHWDDNICEPYYFEEGAPINYASTDSINTNKLAENYTIEYLYDYMKEVLRVETDKRIIDNIFNYPVEIEHNFDFGNYRQYIRYNYPPIINYMPVIMYPDFAYDVPQVDEEEDSGAGLTIYGPKVIDEEEHEGLKYL